MKKTTLSILVLCIATLSKSLTAQTLPKYDHVIFVLEENSNYTEVIGASYAPTFNALAKASYTANFSNAHAITHPSEPNYLALFSGSEQGVTADLTGPAPGAPFNDCNLGASLLRAGYTFIGYSETQPSVGWYAGDNGNYVTKHCPWINWLVSVGDNKDSIPDNLDVPMFPLNTYFPDSTNYSKLPTVAWVIPNSVDDAHDPSTRSTAIANADSWLKTNIMPLIRWAVTHNSLVITIFDEDDFTSVNNMPCFFSGANIVAGTYTTSYNHYDVLRTVEDMYSLPLCGSSSTAKDITGVWTGVNNITGTKNDVKVWPIPAKEELNMEVTSAVNAKSTLGIDDITGRVIKQSTVNIKPGENSFSINIEGLSNGIYFVNIQGNGISLCKKVIVQN